MISLGEAVCFEGEANAKSHNEIASPNVKSIHGVAS